MNNLSFSQKNDLVVKHRDKRCFSKDLELFQKYFQLHRLMNDLARANEFTFERLDGQMLYLLLDKTSIEEILNNREAKEPVSSPAPPVVEPPVVSTEKTTESQDVTVPEISDTSIETLEKKIAALENTTVSKKKSKYEEFPAIDWNNNSNPDIQTCILLYDERVNTYRRMQEMDVLMDSKPELAMEMVELDNRNRQAHRELQLYNDHQTFLFQHPIVARRKQYDDQLAELHELRRSDPEAFIREIANTTQNIRRIKSNLNKKKYKSDEEKQSWENNLLQAEIRETILKEIIGK